MGATMEEAYISDNPDIFYTQILWGAFNNRVLLSSSGKQAMATVKVWIVCGASGGFMATKS